MFTTSMLVTMLFLVLLGWLLGSLINYLSDVLPYTRRLTPGACFGCSRPIPAIEYLMMLPCKVCGQRRNVRAWTVQFLAVVITMTLWFYPFSRVGFWAGTVLLTYFGIVAVIDIEHRLILYIESAAGAVIGFVVGLRLHGMVPTLLGGLAGLAIMAGLYILGWGLAKLFGKLRGKPIEEEALGFGDILLCGVLGLILGWPGIAVGVFSTIFIAGAGSLIILLSQVIRRNYQPFAPVAYGPYLLLAAVLLLYWPK